MRIKFCNSDTAWKGISPGVYSAHGFGGNYIILDTEHDLVVVTRWIDETKIGDVIRLVVRAIENK